MALNVHFFLILLHLGGGNSMKNERNWWTIAKFPEEICKQPSGMCDYAFCLQLRFYAWDYVFGFKIYHDQNFTAFGFQGITIWWEKGARFDFHLLLQPVNQLFAIEHCYSTIIYMLLLMVDIQCIAMNIYRKIPWLISHGLSHIKQ